MTQCTDNVSEDKSAIYDLLPTTDRDYLRTTAKTSVYEFNEVDCGRFSVTGQQDDASLDGIFPLTMTVFSIQTFRCLTYHRQRVQAVTRFARYRK